MNEQMYDDIALERTIKAKFGLTIDVDSVVARHFPISRTGDATLFLTNKKQLFLYIEAQSKFLLSDVRKLAAKIGLKVESYVPPKDRPQYFDEVGQQKFREVFPGRSRISEQDIAFYRTLAPYNPALLLIAEVKDGVVYQYDSDSQGSWRPCTKFAYRRIRTS